MLKIIRRLSEDLYKSSGQGAILTETSAKEKPRGSKTALF